MSENWTQWLSSWIAGPPLTTEELARQRQRLLPAQPLPVIWLLGKTGSGKSSIVRWLTGASQAEIGNGYRPCTPSTQEYLFPSSDQPLLRFLDTRGLEEAGYDPAADVAALSGQAHAVIVTVRAADSACDEVRNPLRATRQAAPERPVILAVTCLHELLGRGELHPTPDPFVLGMTTGEAHWPESIPDPWRRTLTDHQQRFAGLYESLVPLDLTRPEEGYPQPNFGGDRLRQTLIQLLPATYQQVVVGITELRQELQELSRRQAIPIILQTSGLAATAAAVPVPWIDLPVVLGLQSRMVSQIAEIYQQPVGATLVWKIAAAVGPRILGSVVVRGLTKLIPGVGSAVNASITFAYTLTLGEVCCWYFSRASSGSVPTEAELQQHWSDHFQQVTRKLLGRE